MEVSCCVIKWFPSSNGAFKVKNFVLKQKCYPSSTCYDLIVQEDWLEDSSPMWIDYKTKKMKCTVEGKIIELQGVLDDQTKCTQISAPKLKGLLKHGAVSHCI